MSDSFQNSLAVAEAYAEALAPLAAAAGAGEDVLAELEQTARLSEREGLADWSDSPLTARAQTAAVVEEAFRGRVSDLTCDALGVMARRGRLGLLTWIVRAFRRRLLEAQNKVAVTVTTAAPLDEAGRARVMETLRKRLDAEPVLDERVDAGILGGLIVRHGDEVIDLSVANELDQVNRALARWLEQVRAEGAPAPGLDDEAS